MNKGIVFLAILVIVFAYTEATRPRCGPICRKNIPSKITCAKDGHICRKIRQCTVQEVNCRRRLLKQRPLISTSPALCRNIKGPLGSGHCAAIRKPRSTPLNCDRIHCTVPSKKLKCYRSKGNNCRLLNYCQLSRTNCLRGHHNRLRPTHPSACAGLRKPVRLQRCQPIPKSG